MERENPWRLLWNKRRLVLLAGAAALLLAGAAVGILRLAVPPVSVSQAGLRLSFPGVNTNVYPNGRKFSIQDVVAPAVLNKVYETERLSEFGLKPEEFQAAISIEPYLSTYEFVVDRYRSRLADRRMSFAEIEKIEGELSDELKRRASSNALLKFTVRKRFGLPDAVRENVLGRIVSEWARYSIDELGVLNLPEINERRALIDSDIVQLDFPVGLYMVRMKIDEFLERLSKLQTHLGGETLIDADSSHSIGSIRRALEDIRDYEIAAVSSEIAASKATRNPQATQAFFKRRAAQLEVDLKSARSAAERQRQALDDYTSTGNPARISADAAGAAAGSPNFQISDTVLDRIITLSTRLNTDPGERNFRQDLLQKALQHEKSAIAIESELNVVNSVAAIVEGDPGAGAGSNSARADIEARVKSIAARINEYWTVARRLYDALGTSRVSYAAELYQPLPIPADERSFTDHPIWNPLVLFFLLTSMLVAMALAAAFMLLSAFFRAQSDTSSS